MKKLKQRIARWLGITPEIRRSRKLDATERRMAFNVPVGSEPLWWDGMAELLEDCELDQLDLVSEAKLADKPGLLAHCAGGLDMVRTIRAELERRRADAIREEAP